MLVPHPRGPGLGIGYLEDMHSEKDPMSNNGNVRPNPSVAAPKGFTKDNIVGALDVAAGFLHRKNQNITLMTMGGVVDTVLLQITGATEDVFFYNPSDDKAQTLVLKECMDWAVKGGSTNGVPLDKAVNNPTIIQAIGTDFLRKLWAKAEEKKLIVYQAKGLTVVAVPLSYSFIAVASRVDTTRRKHLDLERAVAYLRGWICVNAETGRPMIIPGSLVQRVCNDYDKADVNFGVLQKINHYYGSMFRREGLDLRRK